MKIREQLDQTLARFNELEAMMSDPVVLTGDSSKMAQIMKEHGSLLKVGTKYRNYKSMGEELKELAPMLNSADPDEVAMAQEESNRLRAEREAIWTELLDMSIGGEDALRSQCVLEIRAGQAPRGPKGLESRDP
jgi:peptide chain release factor 1